MPEGTQHRPEGLRESHFCEKRDATARVAGNRCAVAREDPPAVVPCLLGNAPKQARRLFVGERKQGQLRAPV